MHRPIAVDIDTSQGLPPGFLTERLRDDIYQVSAAQTGKQGCGGAARIWVVGAAGAQAMSQEQFEHWR